MNSCGINGIHEHTMYMYRVRGAHVSELGWDVSKYNVTSYHTVWPVKCRRVLVV